jgi:RNA polymerase sigma factor (sigma-70 family)
MATGRAGEVIRTVLSTAARDGAGQTDGQLLESFVRRRDAAAMEALVRRHGPMVWGVCRRALRCRHDAEDAFQTTFLVLVRKAGSIAAPERLANWLYGVAHRTALKARSAAARRWIRERNLAGHPEPADDIPRDDLRPWIDGELSRLPDKYRALIVLCDLEGKSRKAVAEQTGLPEGTVASRLARARTMLARRLAGAGSAALGGWVMSPLTASPPVPESVTVSTVRTAISIAANPASGMVPAPAALTERVLSAMFQNKLKVAAALLLTTAAMAYYTRMDSTPTAVGGEGGAEAGRASSGVPESDCVEVRFASPAGMKIRVLTAGRRENGPADEAPCRLELEPGAVYRLKLSEIPNRPGLELYPTLEIPKTLSTTAAFVTHSAIPVEFRDDDFDKALGGELVTKVVYLVTGSKRRGASERPGETVAIASYDAPDVDVIEEANRRGGILAVVRLGNIDKLPAGEDRGQARDTRGGKSVRQVPNPADRLDAIHRDLSAMRLEMEALRQRLKAAEAEADALRETLRRKGPEARE